MNSPRIFPRLTVTLVILLAVTGFLSLFVGAAQLDRLSDKESLELMLISRLPRLMALLCTGAGMACAGLLMQCLCRNKFVSPTTGATIQSAQLGVLISLLFLDNSTLMGRAFFAFICALIGTWIFVIFIQRVQFKEIILVPLIGIMFGSVIGGITNFLAFKFNLTQALATWTVGHFSTVLRGNYELVYLTLPLLVITFIYAQYFNIAGMGRNFSQNLGINYKFILFFGLTLAAMITASVVSVVGAVSYIGLIIPNIVAIFKGDNVRNILIDTALAGALFVLVCDLIGRLVIYPYEVPIELIIGVVGSITFIGLIFYRLNGGFTLKALKKLAPRPVAEG